MNYGTNLDAWMQLAFVLLCIFMLAALVYKTYRFSNLTFNEKKKQKIILWQIGTISLILVISVWAAMFSFGPGSPNRYIEEPSGAMKLTDSYESETKTKADLDKEAAEHQNKYLKTQSKTINTDDYIQKQVKGD